MLKKNNSQEVYHFLQTWVALDRTLMILFQDLIAGLFQIFHNDMDHETTLAYRYDVLQFHIGH